MATNEAFPQISLDTQETTDTSFITLDTGSTEGMPVSPELAESRARRAEYAVGKYTGKSYVDMYNTILNGGETYERQEAASAIDLQASNNLTNHVQQTLGTRAKPLTPEEATAMGDVIRKLSKATDPSSVVEEQLATQVSDEYESHADNKDVGPVQEAKEEQPGAYEMIKDKRSTTLAKTEYLRTLEQNARELEKGQSWAGWGADFAKGFVPLYPSVKTRGMVEGTGFFDTGLYGQHLEEQGKVLYRLPFEEFKKEADRMYAKLSADNPQLAREYFSKLRGMSSSDVVLNSVFEAVDVATLPGTGLLTKKGIKGVKALSESVESSKSTVKAVAASDGSKEALIEATGNLKESAVQRVVKSLENESSGDPSKVINSALDYNISFLREGAEQVGASGSSREIANRIQRDMLSIADDVVDTSTRVRNVERVGILHNEQIAREVVDSTINRYPEISNNVLDIDKVVPRLDDKTNTWSINFKIAQNDGTLFSSPETAKFFAEYNGIANAQVRPHGAGYYISVTKPIDETTDIIRDNLIKLDSSWKPSDKPSTAIEYMGSVLNKWMTPEESLGLQQRANRKIATYATSELERIAKKASQPIQDLTRTTGLWSKFTKSSEYHDFQRMINVLKTTPDPVTGAKGTWLNTTQDVETFYQQNFKRIPSDTELRAYFAYKTLSEIDYTYRALSVYTNKARVGAEGHIVSWTNKEGKKITLNPIDGVRKRELPGGEDVIAVLNNAPGSYTITAGDKIKSEKFYKKLRRDIDNGTAKVFEIYDPELKELSALGKDFANRRVRYVISYDVKSQPIAYKQLDRRGGGHIEYEYDHYIKQPKVHMERVGSQLKVYYEGDQTLMALPIRGMGEKTVKVLNEMRELFKKSRDASGVKAKKPFIEQAREKAKELPSGIDYNEVRGWFFNKHPDTLTTRLSLDEEIRIVSKDQSILELDGKLKDKYKEGVFQKASFIDGTKRSSLARSQAEAFTQRRDAYDLLALTDEGTKTNPLYKVSPAKFIDPMHTMNKALNRIINTTFMDDYKISAVESWVQRAIDYGAFKDDKDLVRSSPFYYFNNADNTIFNSGLDKTRYNELVAERARIQQFVGTPSAVQASIKSVTSKLMEDIYGTFGPKAIFFDPISMARTKDPIKFVRSIAFHEKLGFFNPATMWANLQTMTSITGIAGITKSVPGLHASILHRATQVNASPQIMKHLDNMASKMNIPGFERWKPGQFIEAWEELNKTGFQNVGGTYAALDDLMPKTVNSRLGTVLDWGTSLFKASESQIRMAAWYTAYLDFRARNPVKALTNIDRDWILDRADLLSGNMSRASNSAMNHGVLSIPTQFYTYSLRAAEQFIGKRLTPGEKANLFFWHTAMYGIPTALGLTGIPISDYLKRTALENGYVYGQNYIDDAVTNGLPATMIKLTTGRQVNLGERWGVGGYSLFKEAMEAESFWKIFQGAAGSSILDGLAASEPMARALLSAFRDDGQAFPVKLDDVLQIGKEISTVNNAYKGYVAIQTGRWVSKKENVITNGISPVEAGVMSLFGLQPQEAADVHLLNESIRNKAQVEKEAEKGFVREMRRFMNTAPDNPEQARQYFTRALAYSKFYPEDKLHVLFKKGFEGSMPLLDRIQWNFYTKNIPLKDQQAKFNTLIQQIRTQQGQ